MNITSDWHIHSRNSCDDAALAMADLIREAGNAGILDFGITDHLHTAYNFPDIVRSREEFLSVNPSPRFHFGIEVSCVSLAEIREIAREHHDNPVYGFPPARRPDGTLAIGITEDDIAKYQIEYVIGGAHWPMNVPLQREAVIRDYHRQNMFLASHPLVDIVAHPWWWMGHWKDAAGKYNAEPWFDDFRAIPRSMHAEFAAAIMEHNKAVEINLGANLMNADYPDRFVRQYLDYLAELQSQGVQLAVGSDCHDAHYSEINFHAAGKLLETVGIKDKNLWHLPPRKGN